MPKYALFNHLLDPPVPVSGWYDTDNFVHDNLPAEDDLLQINSDEWEFRMSRLWAVDTGALVPYDPAPVPLTADEELYARIALGINITSANNSAMNGLWALDGVTMGEIGAVARDYASGLGLPQGFSTFIYPMADATPVEMSGDNVVDLYKAQRDMISELNTQASIMRLGGTPSWPVQATVIP